MTIDEKVAAQITKPSKLALTTECRLTLHVCSHAEVQSLHIVSYNNLSLEPCTNDEDNRRHTAARTPSAATAAPSPPPHK